MNGIEQLPLDVGDAYPTARRAVAHHSSPAFEPFWFAMRARNRSVDYCIQIALDAGVRPDLLDEVKTADFRRFVAAKLGAY